MRIKHLLLMAVAANFAFTACEDTVNGDDVNGENGGDANFWATYQLAPKGVKSIAQDNFTDFFDQNGRLTSTVTSYGQTSYSYNAQGYVSKILSQENYGEGQTFQSTQTLEYNNGDKFCPIPMGPGNVFHIYERGLTKGLSKVTFQGEDIGTITMEYKFQGNTLTISTSGGNKTMIDSMGQQVPMVYDDIIFEYEGNYPRYTTSEHEFIGPMTYQANGQFDTYVEGFYSWTIPGFVTLKRTRTVNKDFKDKLLTDKEVSLYYNDGESTPYDTETITYSYNDKGDVIKETVTHTAQYSESSETTYEYEYDSKGNWTKCTGTMRILNVSGIEPRSWTSERTITYY